ncbi:Crp/Fnr family transcriptional regulator [Gemmobacter denitrificans]|uniref:Crp/Fnr family transcriptional regulator n=1 Tax=Gemmobacter denitrificans TaxID=3123040 RepID=A0ABU8BR86_9RHOB
MNWIDACPLPGLTPAQRQGLERLPQLDLPAGQALFHAGDRAQGFLVILKGRVEVFLTGPSGREILLYAVEPGQSCIQTTLGLMGDDAYAGEALTATDCRAVMIPRGQFLRLMDEAPGFRAFVFRAFGARMAEMTHLLESVAFHRVESRLARALLSMAQDNDVQATQAEIASQIGSAREVVSRKLDLLAQRGLIRAERGRVRLIDPAGLKRLADVT